MKTIKEMLTDRHICTNEVFQITKNEQIEFEALAWTEQTHEQLCSFLATERPVLVDQVALFVYWKPLIGHHDLNHTVLSWFQACESTYQLWPPNHWIIITMTPVRNTDWKELQQYVKQGMRIETFHQGEIEFNITHHEFVPAHRLLTNAEAVSVLRALNTTASQCPQIQLTDVVSRYYGGQVGDVFQIYRHNKYQGDSEVTLRIVCP